MGPNVGLTGLDFIPIGWKLSSSGLKGFSELNVAHIQKSGWHSSNSPASSTSTTSAAAAQPSSSCGYRQKLHSGRLECFEVFLFWEVLRLLDGGHAS